MFFINAQLGLSNAKYAATGILMKKYNIPRLQSLSCVSFRLNELLQLYGFKKYSHSTLIRPYIWTQF